jgi:pyruvate/2-oxoglutarate dehydrogenase complex dihydrolipoamide dehydrogenase (E3) component
VGLEHTITHVEALELEEPPRSLAIIGGGIIGLEFAYLFARLGTRVVVLERLSQVLEGVDAEIRAAVVEHAGPLGITVYTGMRVEAIEPDGPGYRVSATHQAGQTWTETFERVLLAAGMAPAVKGLGLEQVGVGVGRDGIHTDTALRTSVGHIWAAGDVRAGAPKLTQIASYEGRLAARNALSGQTEPVTERIVPYLIGLTPPAAAVGLTEEEAHVAGYPVGVHRQAYREVCPAGNVVGEADGLFKVVYDATSGVLLGAHAFGAGAPELVQQVAFALQGGLTLRQAGTALFTFPGLSEVVWYALRPHPGDPA